MSENDEAVRLLVDRAWDWITGADHKDPAFRLVMDLAKALEDTYREKPVEYGGGWLR